MAGKILGKIRAHKWITTIAVLLVLAVIYSFFKKGGGTNLQLANAELRNITQTVSETGNVEPVKNVDLAFKTGGIIASVSAAVGQHVFAGQALASLQISELGAQLAKAQADSDVQTAKTAQDQNNLNNTYSGIPAALNSAFTSTNDAVRVKIDPMYNGGETSNPQLVFYSSILNNAQGQLDSTSQRISASIILNSWSAQISSLSASTPTSTLEQDLQVSLGNLNSIETLLSTLNNILLNVPGLNQSTALAYKGYVSTAKAEVDASLTSVNSITQNISSQKAVLNSDAASQRSYAAQIQDIKAQLAQATVYSPISGVVTVQNAIVGEVAPANTGLISVISDGSLEIDTNIPEVDIAKVAVGDQAKVTLDAYGNDTVFDATVTSIDPGETIIEGVATYLTKLNFLKPDSRIKPGMTANIDITSATHQNVLAVPQRAVRRVQDQEIATIFANATTTDVQVTTGLRGSDGYVEILSGLKENDQVVIPHS